MASYETRALEHKHPFQDSKINLCPMPDQDDREARILEVLEITEHPAANFQGRLWQIKVRVDSRGEEFETSLSRLFQDEAKALTAGDIVLI